MGKKKRKNSYLNKKEYSELKQAEKKLLEIKELLLKAKEEFDKKVQPNEDIIIIKKGS